MKTNKFLNLEDSLEKTLKELDEIRQFTEGEERTNWSAIALLWSKLSEEQKEGILKNSEYSSEVVGAIKSGVNNTLHIQALASGKDPHSEEVTSQYI